MAGIRLDIRFDKTGFLKDPRIAETAIQQELRLAMANALRAGKKIAQNLTPQGATGNLKGSIVTKQAKGRKQVFGGKIEWTAAYAPIVNNGGPPRAVQIGRLRAWAAAVLGDAGAARAVQSSIMRTGTPSPNNPRPGLNMDTRTEEQLQPILDRLLRGVVDRVARRLN